MEADWWARGMACGALAVGFVNGGISLATFFRRRSRVKVQVFRTGVPTGAEDDLHASEYQFVLRFTNRGSAPVGVERIELWAHLSRLWPEDSQLLKGVRFRDEDPNSITVPAHNGTKYTMSLPEHALVGGEVPAYLRFQVLLSDGRTVQSNRHRKKDIPGL
ncbi:hypothetical protein [Streptomyces sp. NPDC058718]|uniref:hypothetical protein n=1 Tax=Streptomyces sp. NPDC058718 TaxID=3346610 RepID=UPI0036A59B58